MMTEEQKKNRELVESFPFLLPLNSEGKPNEGYDYTYTELDSMPDGWRKAFGEDLCRELNEALVRADKLQEYRISQIKEKFGTLRWYASYTSHEVEKVIRKYVKLSERTCIECGKPATQITTGYICPYCDDCVPKSLDGKKEKTVPIEAFYRADAAYEDGYVFVRTWDPGTPPFVTSYIEYMAKEKVAESIEHLEIVYPRKLRLIDKVTISQKDWEYTHLNVWGFPYSLKASNCTVECRYYSHSMGIFRAVQIRMDGLEYIDSAFPGWQPVTASHCWGIKGALVDTPEGDLMSAVWFMDKQFKTKAEALNDKLNPQEIGYDLFCNEIFADG